jgi:hypothetical protein
MTRTLIEYTKRTHSKYLNAWQYGSVSDRIQVILRIVALIAVLVLTVYAFALTATLAGTPISTKLLIGGLITLVTTSGLHSYLSTSDNEDEQR